MHICVNLNSLCLHPCSSLSPNSLAQILLLIQAMTRAVWIHSYNCYFVGVHRLTDFIYQVYVFHHSNFNLSSLSTKLTGHMLALMDGCLLLVDIYVCLSSMQTPVKISLPTEMRRHLVSKQYG